MTLQPGSLSAGVLALARKKERARRKKHPALVPGQLDFAAVADRAFQEKVRWKGGMTRLKNVPENFSEEE